MLDSSGLAVDCPFLQQWDLLNKINNLERFHEMLSMLCDKYPVAFGY
jgi:Fe-S-cluster containining protein